MKQVGFVVIEILNARKQKKRFDKNGLKRTVLLIRN